MCIGWCVTYINYRMREATIKMPPENLTETYQIGFKFFHADRRKNGEA